VENGIMNTQTCQCSKPKYKLVFACSGAADVGEITDQAARRLTKEKTASMCCSAAVAADIPEIIEKTQNAERVLALDGCPKDCVKTILQKSGFTNFKHVQLETVGLKKGESPLTEINIETVLNQSRLLLTA
jgi:uncharacterized metal-binding protein